MHSYSISTNTRITTIATIAVASGVVGQMVNPYLTNLGLTPYGTMAIFGLLFAVFNFAIWNWGLLQKLHSIPDLNGTWEGTLTRPGNGADVERAVKMQIHQNFTQLSIVFEGQRSMSRSTSATLVNSNKNDIQLHWTYFSSDNTGDASANLYGHGTTMLTKSTDAWNGTYYSTKLQKGRLTLEKAK